MAKGQPTSSVAAADLENEIQKQARKPLRQEIEALIASWRHTEISNEELDDGSVKVMDGKTLETAHERDSGEQYDVSGSHDASNDRKRHLNRHDERDNGCANQHPPFSDGELVIMAIICNNEAYITGKIVCDWMLETFPYFLVDERRKTSPRLKFLHAYYDAEVPLTEKKEEKDSIKSSPVELAVTTKPCQARIYLRRLLQPARQGVFRFFDLPAELRNRVYEELLVYPGAALAINRRISRCEVSKRVGEAGERTEKIWGTWLKIACPAHTLELLLTCKQFYSEAMPIYYGLNSFIFPDARGLSNALQRLSTDRAHHMKNIEVDVDLFVDGEAPENDSLRAASVSLDKLQIRLSDFYASKLVQKPQDCARVKHMKLVSVLAVRAKTVDTRPSEYPEETGVHRNVVKVFHQYMLAQAQQAGSNTKFISSVEENGDEERT